MSFQKAQTLHGAGRLDKAEPLYRTFLQQSPDDESGLFWLATLLTHRGKFAEALPLYERALVHSPESPDTNLGMSICLIGLSRFLEAEITLRFVTETDPTSPEPHYYLGTALYRQGYIGEAEREYREALRLKPDLLEALLNLCELLKTQKRVAEADVLTRQIAVLKANQGKDKPFTLPKRAGIKNESTADLFTRAEKQTTEKDFEGVLKTLKRVKPPIEKPEIYALMANAFHSLRRYPETEEAARQALKLDSRNVMALNLLGNALIQRGQYEEAIEPLSLVARLRPDVAEYALNLGYALMGSGRMERGIAATKRALELRPDYPNALSNLMRLQLVSGDYEEGWKTADRMLSENELNVRQLSVPQWDGSKQNDKTLFLHMTEGFGDNLQFVRYLPMAAERVESIVLESYSQLLPLLKRTPGYDTIVERTHANRDTSGTAFDLHLKLYDLPRVFRTTLDTIPAPVPYLFADQEKVAHFGGLFEGVKGRKIGIVWAGRPTFINDHNRSIHLSDYALLSELSLIEDVHFYSLQFGEKAGETQTPPPGMNLTDLSPDIETFDDTAALMENLDLIISVDTSSAHLAGGLGKPVWTLLPFICDWRWGTNSETTPWYPTMRLFRQPSPGDWESVLQKILQELRA